ncbi:hypothetical protein PGB90_006013 [Kerria lacca]
MILVDYTPNYWDCNFNFILYSCGELVSYNSEQKFTVPRGNLGVYDPTEIHNRGQVQKNIQQCLFIIAWFLLNFFLDMYLGILSILKGDNISELATIEAEGIPYNSSM